MSELDIQKAIVEHLKVAGYEPYRMPLGPVVHGGRRKKHPLKGFPDLFTFSKHGTGRLITIECKTPKGKFKPEQIDWRQRLQSSGAIYIVGLDPLEVLEEIRLLDVA